MSQISLEHAQTIVTRGIHSFELQSAKDPLAEDIKIGENIRRVRRQKNLTQDELGKLIGLTFQQIQKYERGKNRISAGKLVVLARKLGVGIEEFVSDAPEPSVLDIRCKTQVDRIADALQRKIAADIFEIRSVSDLKAIERFIELAREC